MKLLALDFDGVISDSARESFRVALRTWSALFPAHPLPRRAGDGALYRAFLELMPLGNRAEDYGVALASIRAEEPLADQAAYDAFKARLGEDFLHSFHRRFYVEREALAAADPVAWRDLMRPYPELPDILRRHAGEVALAIASSKDRRSVRRLLESYGMEDLFPEGRVLDKEAGVSKRAHVERLAAGQGVPPAEITFVDDKVNHLESVAPLGARCVLAAWGYNGERERRIACREGFLVCALEDFEAKVFG